jgi:hypothetical protein
MTSPGLATLNLKCRGLESQGELETPIGKIIFIQKIIIQHHISHIGILSNSSTHLAKTKSNLIPT